MSVNRQLAPNVFVIVSEMLTDKVAYAKVSANTASSVPKFYKKSDGSQDARRGYPDMPN